MKIQFCGAAQEVTGSSHFLTLKNGHTILIDCGLYQGNSADMYNYNSQWNFFDPRDIDFLILTHAHIDHIGRVPRLVRDGFRGEILCTHATRSLASIMLLDAAKINREEAEDGGIMLFDEEDVRDTMRLFTGLSYDRWHFVEVGLDCMFKDAGHILGSASVTLKVEEEGEEPVLVGFTGDIGRPDRPILRDPQPMPKVDYLVCESTYGDKEHKNYIADIRDLLLVVRKTCVLNEGKLLIPAFSMGRTQELIYMLDPVESKGDLPHIDVYVDSPLAVNAMDIYKTHPECYDEQLQEYMLEDSNPFGFNGLKYVRRGGLADRLAQNDDPCIIISASGMLNSGRVVRHLYHLVENWRNTILMVGYCSPRTLGGKLLRGAKEVFLYGEEKKVNANVERLVSFSAHADRSEIYNVIQHQKDAKKLFLVHGERDTQEKFRDYLHERGFGDIEIPDLGEEFKL